MQMCGWNSIQFSSEPSGIQLGFHCRWKVLQVLTRYDGYLVDWFVPICALVVDHLDLHFKQVLALIGSDQAVSAVFR